MLTCHTSKRSRLIRKHPRHRTQPPRCRKLTAYRLLRKIRRRVSVRARIENRDTRNTRRQQHRQIRTNHHSIRAKVTDSLKLSGDPPTHHIGRERMPHSPALIQRHNLLRLSIAHDWLAKMHRKPRIFQQSQVLRGIHMEQDRMTSLPSHTRYLNTARGFTHIKAFGREKNTAHNKLRQAHT